MPRDATYEHEAIWPPEQIRIMATRAVEAVGGPAGFRAIGPTMRRAIVVQACWDAVRTMAAAGPVTVTAQNMYAVERAMREAAGIAEESREG
jgi:hypothetical protein